VSYCAHYTGETPFEVKTEADGDDVIEHLHDDVPRLYMCCDSRFILVINLNDHKLTHTHR